MTASSNEGPSAGRVRAGRTRRSEVLVGLSLVAVFALAGFWLSSGTEPRGSVVGARVDIARGQVIDTDDLRVVEIPIGAGIAAISDKDVARVIGQVASFDIAAGTLLTANAVLPDTRPGPNEATVGLALPVGRYPSASLAAGDTVRVVRLVAAEPGATAAVELLIAEAAVIDIVRPGTQGDVLVSLAMPIASADVVAAAAADNAVSLLLVAPTEAER